MFLNLSKKTENLLPTIQAPQSALYFCITAGGKECFICTECQYYYRQDVKKDIMKYVWGAESQNFPTLVNTLHGGEEVHLDHRVYAHYYATTITSHRGDSVVHLSTMMSMVS